MHSAYSNMEILELRNFYQTPFLVISSTYVDKGNKCIRRGEHNKRHIGVNEEMIRISKNKPR